MLLSGCGDAPQDVAQKAETEEEGATEIAVPDAAAEFPGSWKLDADSGSFRVEGEDETSVKVQQVKGQLMKGDSIESRFTADSGEAHLASGRLLLEGRVRVTSEKDKIYLVADRVTYDEKAGLIVAEGGVEVHSDAWMSGPYDRLVATPGLERVGTADRFGL